VLGCAAMRLLIPASLSGLAAVVALTGAAYALAGLSALEALSLSPLALGIVLGIVVGNTAPATLRARLSPGILFAAKKLLKVAIVFYGFRITFIEIGLIGWRGLAIDLLMVGLTMTFGMVIGVKFLRMDWRTAVLTSAGSSICGAAAIVATEPIVRAEAHQTAAAVGTVVLFGTLAMFLYPVAFRSGWIAMDEETFGVYIGATIHGVSHVVGAAGSVSDAVCDGAMITKMTRVMLLAPFLLVLSAFAHRSHPASEARPRLTIPWFALGFIAVAGFNSFALLPPETVNIINHVDTFLLTVAMTALGMNTVVSKLRGMGMKPLYLASALFLWLVVGGYSLTALIM